MGLSIIFACWLGDVLLRMLELVWVELGLSTPFIHTYIFELVPQGGWLVCLATYLLRDLPIVSTVSTLNTREGEGVRAIPRQGLLSFSGRLGRHGERAYQKGREGLRLLLVVRSVTLFLYL